MKSRIKRKLEQIDLTVKISQNQVAWSEKNYQGRNRSKTKNNNNKKKEAESIA